MQYTNIYKAYKATHLKRSSGWIKALLTAISAIYLFLIIKNEALPVVKSVLSIALKTNNLLYLIAVIVLLPFNWLLEALKWNMLVRKTEETTLISSLKGILTGVTLGLVTPHGIGDYPGRILQLNGKDRLQCLGFILLTRATQLYATLTFGGISVIYLMWMKNVESFLISTTSAFVIITNLLFLSLLFHHKRQINFFRNIQWLQPVYHSLALIKKVRAEEIWVITGISMLRYIVFSGQFLLLLYYFQIDGTFLHFCMGIFFVFLAKSVFPTFFELGVRETAAVFFFSSLNAAPEILCACIALWLINIVVPAMAGFFMLPKIKLVVQP